MTWNELIEIEMNKEYFKELETFIKNERKITAVFPSEDCVYKAFDLSPFEDVKVVILGQDPYHQPGQAMGLSFSVPKDQKLPKSIINIFKELKEDLGIENSHGDLSSWALQGVFLLNTLLTVEKGKPLSHSKKGWETFSDVVLKMLGEREIPIVFILWGKEAQKKKHLIMNHHLIIESSHPSPLGAYRGFWGSKPFSRANKFLVSNGLQPIDWRNYV